MSWWSWPVVFLGITAAIIAVQFDNTSLEIAGATVFVAVFAWIVVVARRSLRLPP